MKSKALLLVLLFIAVAAIGRAVEPWEWPSEPTFERYADQLHGSIYTVTFAPDRFGEGTAEIKNSDGNVLYRWPAHKFTSFMIHGGRLYYSDYRPITPRVAMHCVDLGKQREVWHLTLPQNGPALNSKYYNRVNIALRGDTLLVFSRQSWRDGKFSWRLSPDTGKLLE